MKKVFFALLLISLFAGCTKEEISNESQLSSTVPDYSQLKVSVYKPELAGTGKTGLPPMLYLPTISDYDNLLNVSYGLD
jgi:hypothetical protein